jgi:hypothetical protein
MNPQRIYPTDCLGHETIYYHHKGLVAMRIDPDGAENIFHIPDETGKLGAKVVDSRIWRYKK